MRLSFPALKDYSDEQKKDKFCLPDKPPVKTPLIINDQTNSPAPAFAAEQHQIR